MCKEGGFVNKNDLISAIAERSELSRADAAKVVEGVLTAITQSLQKGEDVRLVGFGTFALATRAASVGRNPRTGEEIQIPQSKQPKFKVGKALKDALQT
ncbi:HU family DNA-binding protein [Insolitispirillum peregrinum]|uniref:HU family DNA-binding protein n=1 Tax=Insolitispirillum peregrinum TaxID=80876 RepID=UPI0024820EFD|nr:HU family DNA-binding protein [Insolitispirillum peregrinum]